MRWFPARRECKEIFKLQVVSNSGDALVGANFFHSAKEDLQRLAHEC